MSEESRETNVTDFVDELEAGVLKAQLAAALSDAALKTIVHGGRKAKVTLDFTIAQIGDAEQVMVTHKLSSAIPTSRGTKKEDGQASTPMFVGKGGKMTINMPKEERTGQFSLQSEQDGQPPRRVVDIAGR